MRLMKSKSPVMCVVVALLLQSAAPLIAGEHFAESAKSSVIRMAPPAPVFDEKTRMAELAGRRARVAESVGAKGILILFSTEPRVYTNDVEYEYRQENNLYYLTNLKQKGATLVLTPSNEVSPAILFLPKRNPAAETWTGHMYSAAEASQVSGIKEIWELPAARADDDARRSTSDLSAHRGDPRRCQRPQRAGRRRRSAGSSAPIHARLRAHRLR